jgi:pimeloyl-ACP methyl ester carboxylesterase
VRTVGDHGPPVLLLHGLAGSGRYWGADYDQLGRHGRLVVPDLLGFGASPRPASGYGPAEHADALAACLDELGADRPALVVGHSLGALVALALAAHHPGRVGAVVAFSPPLYRTPAEAARRVGRLGLTARFFGRPGPLSRAACRWMCTHRDAAAGVAQWWRPDLPVTLARDGVQHSWASYSQTFQGLILGAAGEAWVDATAIPVRFVAGAADRVPDVAYLEELAASRPGVSLAVWAGADHDLPLTQPKRCIDEILAALEAMRSRVDAGSGASRAGL